jgi:hypothetical protein
MYFKTIKTALDALIAGICQHRGVTPEVACQLAGAYLRNMSQEWRSGQTPTIAYGDPLCRFAYLYCHTAANAAIFELFLRSHQPTTNYLIQKLNENEELRVCAFGGGPGTELLALTKFLSLRSSQLLGHGEVSFTLIDNTAEWAESWSALHQAIKSSFETQYGSRRNWPFTISKMFQPYDMTRVEQFANLPQLFTQDLYVMNYVVSEIFENHQALAAVVQNMVQNAPIGARFMIVDRNQNQVVANCRQLLQLAGLNEEYYLDSSTNMDADEQLVDLEPYKTHVTWAPRVNWRGAFCLYGVKQ